MRNIVCKNIFTQDFLQYKKKEEAEIFYMN